MKFIVNDKVYDTDKMELLGTVRKWYEFTGWLDKALFGEGMGRKYDCKLYRTQKGNYLLTHEPDSSRTVAQAITEEEAKRLLVNSDYDTYCKYFGELEEA